MANQTLALRFRLFGFWLCFAAIFGARCIGFLCSATSTALSMRRRGSSDVQSSSLRVLVMNTPKKLKRYAPVMPTNAMRGVLGLAIKGRMMRSGLHNEKYAVKLAAIVTEFEHLNDHMAKFMAELSGMDADTAGYVLRELRAPSVRTGVMERLLHFAQRNEKLGPEYDQVLKEFGETAALRNAYAHGRWWTSEKGNLVVFAPTDDYHILEYANAAPITSKELNYAIYRILRTAALVSRLTLVPPEQRAQLPTIPPLEPPPKNSSVLRKILTKDVAPPPPPSAGSPRKPKGERKKERKAKIAARLKKDD